LKQIRAMNPAIPILIMTAYSSVNTAVEALRSGAHDYLIKPLDFDLLRHTLEKALAHTRLSAENASLKQQIADREDGILGKAPPMAELRGLIATVGPTEATVLITGESGTGKELVARALHQASGRAGALLVTVNCAALAENLLESELFGHEKGAYTGADKQRDGRFKQADKGTLFLDEIGEMPLALQSKLLRAIQHGEVQRLGSDSPVTVDVRVLAATNRNLAEEVAAGRFRDDLYYRLNVISLHVPPLRERQEDIPLLAMYFLARFAAKNHKTIRGFTPQAFETLSRHPWPGNVRELENAVERAVILSPGEYVGMRELPLSLARPQTETGHVSPEESGAFLGLSLEEMERRAIIATLRDTNANKSETARRLGITRATLHSKLKKFGLEE
jgi:two-component system response regulator HydG